MEKTRLDWVDNARGLTILLVVLGHSPLWPEVDHFLQPIRMPFFFFLSGLFFRDQYLLGSMLTEKARKILLPYLIFATISYLLWLAVRPFSEMAGEISATAPVIGTLFGVNEGAGLAHNSALWFLPCLFLVHVLLYGLSRIKGALQWLMLTALVALGGVVVLFEQRLLWSFDSALAVVLFAFIGYRFSSRLKRAKPLPVLLLIASGVIAFFVASINSAVNVGLAKYGNYTLFLITGLTSSFFMMEAIKRIPRIPVLVLIGQNSLYIFGLHFLFFLMLTGVSKKLLNFPLFLTYPAMQQFHPEAPLPLVLAIFLMVGIGGPLVIRYCFQLLKQVNFRKLPERSALPIRLDDLRVKE